MIIGINKGNIIIDKIIFCSFAYNVKTFIKPLINVKHKELKIKEIKNSKLKKKNKYIIKKNGI